MGLSKSEGERPACSAPCQPPLTRRSPIASPAASPPPQQRQQHARCDRGRDRGDHRALQRADAPRGRRSRHLHPLGGRRPGPGLDRVVRGGTLRLPARAARRRLVARRTGRRRGRRLRTRGPGRRRLDRGWRSRRRRRSRTRPVARRAAGGRGAQAVRVRCRLRLRFAGGGPEPVVARGTRAAVRHGRVVRCSLGGHAVPLAPHAGPAPPRIAATAAQHAGTRRCSQSAGRTAASATRRRGRGSLPHAVRCHATDPAAAATPGPARTSQASSAPSTPPAPSDQRPAASERTDPWWRSRTPHARCWRARPTPT